MTQGVSPSFLHKEQGGELAKKAHGSIGIIGCASICDCAYGVEYQPIVDLGNGEILGYEALARFYNKEGRRVDTHAVFDTLCSRGEALFRLEQSIKDIQCAHRPTQKKIFVNISAYAIRTKEEMRYWADYFGKIPDAVIEIVEDKEHIDIGHPNTKAFVSMLSERGIPYALDDFFSEDISFSSHLMTKAPIIKLDRIFIERIRENSNYAHFLKGIADYCMAENKILIAEGIETIKDYDIVRSLGVQYGQGYYFRHLFVSPPALLIPQKNSRTAKNG